MKSGMVFGKEWKKRKKKNHRGGGSGNPCFKNLKIRIRGIGGGKKKGGALFARKGSPSRKKRGRIKNPAAHSPRHTILIFRQTKIEIIFQI